jgi:outer membrane protein assembly factor BamB
VGHWSAFWSKYVRSGVVLGLLASLAVVVGPSGLAHAATADWPAFMFGPDHASYNASATSITPSNVANLQPVWRWTVPASPNSGSTALIGTPVSVDGVFYIGANDGEFYAVSESTGQVLWSQFLGLISPFECSATPLGIKSTATVAIDASTGKLAVYVNAPNGYLYALDAATGDVLWQQVVGIPSSTENDYFAWGSPLVANGNVYVGIASDCDEPLVPAGVLGFNAGTGASLGEWHTLPNNEIGGSVWSTPAALADGSIIATTGNGPTSPGPLYTDSIVRLDGTSMKVLDSWQIPAAQQVPDGDFGASATVFTAGSTEMVGACNKDGIFYALKADDLSAGPVWQRRINNINTGANGLCVSGAIWDGTRLIQGAGDTTTINGVNYQGGLYGLNPATGAPLWETGLPGQVIGSPTEDGSGVVAAQIWASSTNNYGIYLLNAANGAILRYIPLGENPIFGQPVFADNYLLVDGVNPYVGVTAYQITTPGPSITAVSPGNLARGATRTFTLTGSGFSGTPSVFVSSTRVRVNSVQVTSPTTLSVKLTATSTADIGPRDIVVVQSGPVADTCSSCLTVDPAPTLSSVTPDSIPAGETATVSFAGTNLKSGAKVTSATGITFGSTTFVSSSQLTAQATVGPSVTPGSYNVTIANPDAGTATCTDCLTVIATPTPTLTAVSPNEVGQQSPKITLLLTGTDFTTNSVVAFSASGIVTYSQHYTSPTSLSVTIAAQRQATLGAGNVTVTTPGGSATCTGCLVIDPYPALTKISPNSIASGTAAQITVTGTNFVSGLSVTTTIPGATVSTPANVTSTSASVQVTVPSGTTAGNYVLRVVNPDGGTGSITLAVT